MSEEEILRLLAHRSDVLEIVRALCGRTARAPHYSADARQHIRERLCSWADTLRDTSAIHRRSLQ